MKIIESALVVSAQDKTDALNATIKRVESAYKAMETFRKATERFAAARSQMRQAEVAVKAAATAMNAVEKPTKAMEAAYKAAVTAVKQASRAFEVQKAMVLGAKGSLEGYGIAVTRLAAEQQRLAGDARHANSVLAEQQKRFERMQKWRQGVGS